MKKFNKKGFTLIELLAVIAILSILIVVAFPGVISLYNSAKQNTFKAQAQSVFRSVEQQVLKNSLETTTVTCYSGGSGLPTTIPANSFEMTGNIRYKATISGETITLNVQQMNGSTVVYSSTVTKDTLSNFTISTSGTAITACS